MWHDKRRVEPEDIVALRQEEEMVRHLEELDRKFHEQRPIVERMWADILKSLQYPWRF